MHAPPASAARSSSTTPEGRGAYTSGWVGFKKGSVSKVTSTGFLQNEAATMYLRIKTSNGTSKWSKGRAITSLPHC